MGPPTVAVPETDAIGGVRRGGPVTVLVTVVLALIAGKLGCAIVMAPGIFIGRAPISSPAPVFVSVGGGGRIGTAGVKRLSLAFALIPGAARCAGRHAEAHGQNHTAPPMHLAPLSYSR